MLSFKLWLLTPTLYKLGITYLEKHNKFENPTKKDQEKPLESQKKSKEKKEEDNFIVLSQWQEPMEREKWTR